MCRILSRIVYTLFPICILVKVIANAILIYRNQYKLVYYVKSILIVRKVVRMCMRTTLDKFGSIIYLVCGSWESDKINSTAVHRIKILEENTL